MDLPLFLFASWQPSLEDVHQRIYHEIQEADRRWRLDTLTCFCLYSLKDCGYGCYTDV